MTRRNWTCDADYPNPADSLANRIERRALAHGRTLSERELADAVTSIFNAGCDSLDDGPHVCIYTRNGRDCPGTAGRACPWPSCDIPF